MANAGNEEDGNPMGEWVNHVCPSVTAGWVLKLQLGVCWV